MRSLGLELWKRGVSEWVDMHVSELVNEKLGDLERTNGRV